MKKKNLKSLRVKKSTISNLNKSEIVAGLQIKTYYFQCGTGPETIICTYNCTYNCTATGCGTTYNSMNKCATIERDANTIPIC
jgi:hypothetical protein